MKSAYAPAKEAAAKHNVSQHETMFSYSEKAVSNTSIIRETQLAPRVTQKTEGVKSSTINGSRVRPFLKWAGGKTQLLPEIRKFYPFNSKNSKITKYAEPFVGGGAVLFDILNSVDLQEVYISDLNGDLINTYIVIRDNVDELLSILQRKQAEFLPLDLAKRKEHFYIQRDNFNNLKHMPSNDNRIMQAALMIYLNKTCFNGLYRVNRKGDYNVPVGAYKRPLICDEENLQAISKMLQNINIQQADYKNVTTFADEHTFIYFDPPYRPLTKTANFTSYTETEFNDEKQLELADFIKKLSGRGCKILASNSDPKNTDEDDNFLDDAYAGLNIYRVQASRMINSKGSARGKISELLISNY